VESVKIREEQNSRIVEASEQGVSPLRTVRVESTSLDPSGDQSGPSKTYGSMRPIVTVMGSPSTFAALSLPVSSPSKRQEPAGFRAHRSASLDPGTPRLGPIIRCVAIGVDVGNTAIKIAPVDGGRVGPVRRLPSSDLPDAPMLEDALREVTGTDGGSALAGATIALVSVVPAWTTLVQERARVIGAQVRIADAATIPLRADVAQPERVGSDRLLAAWAARETHGAPTVVVSLGTATTIDAVDASGAFVGGAILPGIALAIAALSRGTAQLPQVPIGIPEHLVGRSTVEAIQSGAVLGHVEAVSGLIRRIAAELAGTGRQPTVILTGGGSAADWAREIAGVDVADPELLLRGLGLFVDQPAPSPA
jgi:type III pantothenate kinase